VAIDPNSIVWDAPVAAPAMGGGMIPTVSPAAATASAQSLREQQANAFGGGAGILWDDEVQGPPRADFSNVQAGVTRTAMTPLQASGEVPLPSDWQGQRPPARAATLPNFRDVIDSVDPFAAITESAPARNLVDNVRKSKFGRGAAERFHRANAFAAKLEAVPGIIWDSASSAITGEPTTAAQDFFFRAAESSERAADENALRPGAGFFETLAHGAGGLAVDLPIWVATEGGGAVASAAETIAPSATRIVGNALLRSARVSSIPASVNATDTAQRVLDRGGSGEEALRAGLGSAASDVVATAVPLGVEGGTFRRLISGAGAGGAAAAAGSQIRNAALPEDMRVQPEAGELGVGAVQGAALGALLGPRASRSGRDVRPRNAATDVFDRAAQRAAGEDDGIQWDEPRQPLALPAPVIDVTSDGVARTPAQRLQLEEAAAAELARKAELGLTPDVERAIARRENAQEAPDLTQQRDNDAPPWWVAGQAEEAAFDADTAKPAKSPSNWRAELAEHPDVPDDVRTAIADRYEAAEKTLPKFDADVRDIADSVGGRAIVAPLKGVTRTVDKVIGDYSGDVSRIKDVLRATIELPHHTDADTVIDQLRAKYGEPIKLNNTLDPSQPADPRANGYRDINSVWSIDGMPVEIQVNVPEMLAAKERAHPFYEEQQKIQRRLKAENRAPTTKEVARLDELSAEQEAIYRPAWEAASRRMNSSREISSASSRNSEPEIRSPDGQVRQSYRSSDASRPSGNTPNMARGPNLGSEAGRGARTSAIAFTSGESVPQRGSEWVPFDKDSGTLGVPRAEMPQIKLQDRDSFIRFLASRGIEGEDADVPAGSLKPTQAEFSPAKVAHFVEAGPMDGSRDVLVSSDGYILDGHHQWMAHQATGTDVPVVRLNAPIRELLKAANEFPGVQRSEGQHEARNRPPAQPGLFTAGGKPRPSDAERHRQSERGAAGRAAADTVSDRVTDKGASRDGSAEAELEGPGHVASRGSNGGAAAGADAGKAEGPRGRTRRDVPRADESAARGDEALKSGARDGGQSVESLRASLHASSIGTALRSLERTGVLRLIDDPGQKFAGRWDGQHAVLNAAHIPVGPDGFAVALHELGIHRERDAGLRGMLGDDVFNGLVKRITEIESTTAPILREAREAIAEARARIEAAGTPTHQRDEELLAYTAEAAARRLAAGSKNGVLRDLLDRIVRRIRAWLVTGPIGKALAARGFALKVTPDDLVAIAQAAVRRQAREAARVEPVPTSAAEARYSQPVTLTPRQERALGKIGVTGRRESPREAFRRITENAGKRLTQGIVDQFAPLKDLDMTAYMQARLSKGTDGALEAAFLHGMPKLTDGALDIDVDGKGLRGILAELDGEHAQFLAWVAGNRAAKLKSEGRERLFTDDDIAELKSLNQGKMANGRIRGIAYAKAQEAFKRYQKAVLDIAEQAGLIDGESRAAWESDFYVPFYRIAEDDPSAFVPGKVGSGLVRQQAFKKLKGGTAELNDLLSNTLANWSHLLTASMRNMAATKALAAAEKLGIAERIREAEKGSVWISVKGKQVHYRVEDPLVLDALTALNYTGIKGAGMDAMRWFRHALTMGVTISPTFRIRNLLRDTISVLAVSDDAGYNPLRNIVDGWHGTRAGSATDIKLLAGGGKIRFGSLNDGQQARNAKRLIEMGIEDSQILDTQDKIANALHAAFDWWKEVGDRSETINRAAVYQNAIKAGKSHLEASFEARDLLDFTAGGKWASVRFLTGVVPFLNARIQGIYKLGKAARGNPLRFAAVAGTVALASALNYLLQKDDPDYKALPDWARDTYWCVKLGDKMLFIPKPFEIGAMGSIVERMTELAVSGGDYTAGDFAHTLAAIISDQLSMNPIPQAVKPAMEAAFNYDMFRGRPIDSMGDERLPPGDRVGPTTSAGAVALGRAAGVSPKRIEHLARGYFGWLGTQALNASDWALRDAMDLPSNPRRDLTDINNVFVIGDFLKNARLNSDKYVTRFYAAQEQIDAIYAAHSLARKTGDEARESELAESRELRMRPTYQAANKRISRINQRIKAIANDREMSAREKRIALDELYAERAEIAREADEEARATP